MVWTAPITFVPGDALTAAQLNTFVRANLLESAPAKAVEANRMIVANGVNAIGERQWARDYAGEDFTTEAQFPSQEDAESADSPGPHVTVEHTGRMLVLYNCQMAVQSGGGNAIYAPGLEGSSPENSNQAVRSGASVLALAGGITILHDEPGISTVTMYYGVSNTSSTALFRYRRLAVLPF